MFFLQVCLKLVLSGFNIDRIRTRQVLCKNIPSEVILNLPVYKGVASAFVCLSPLIIDFVSLPNTMSKTHHLYLMILRLGKSLESYLLPALQI